MGESQGTDTGNGLHFGKYQVVRSLGEGGMGVVYLAFDPDLERHVAIKAICLSKKGAAEALRRFDLEAKTLARLNSPHIVHLFEYCATADPPYLVMEYVEGRSLQADAASGGRKGMERLLDCAWQTLGGLATAHAASIIHRDIKPANILLSSAGVYKLADFGLARPQDINLDITGEGMVAGTPRYMPPEVACGRPADARSDLYSLGATLFELACGRPMFMGETATAIFSQISTGRPPPLSSLRPDLPPAFSEWLARMVERDPRRRFASALEARDALDALAPAPGMPGASATLSVPSRPPGASGGAAHAPAAPRRRLRVPFMAKAMLAIWGAACLAGLAAGAAVHRVAAQQQKEMLRRELQGLAAAIALHVDGDAHARLARLARAAAETDGGGAAVEADPDFQRLRGFLTAHIAATPSLSDAYTMARGDRDGILFFVADGLPERDANGNGMLDPDERAAKPGEPYNPSFTGSNAMLEAFSAPTSDSDVTHDQWGATLSGYAPIRASDGTVSGIVGVDASPESLAAAGGFLARCCGIGAAAILLLSLPVSFLAARSLARPMAAFAARVRAAGRGDLSVPPAAGGGGDLQDLSDALDVLLASLREREALRKAYARHMARKMADVVGGRSGDSSSASALLPRRITCLYIHMRMAAGSASASRSDFLDSVFPAFFHAMTAHGGMLDRVYGEGIVVAFGEVSEEQQEEQAIRAALAIHEAMGRACAEARESHPIEGMGVCAGGRSACGGASREEQMRRARLLGQAAGASGHLLLVCGGCFGPVRHMFAVTPVQVPDPDSGESLAAFSVRGAVSG